MTVTQFSPPRHGLPVPIELQHWILQDLILENIHCRLTRESCEELSWNSLIVLPQICCVFHSICTQICGSLLGDPTAEQEEGLWHAKSPLEHTRDVVEHLSRFSPSRLPKLPSEDVDTCMVALLNAEYRASVLQAPGLLGLYEFALNSTLVRTAVLRRGYLSQVALRTLMAPVSGALRAMRVFPTSRCGKLMSQKLLEFTSELNFDWDVNMYRFAFWTAACCFNNILSQEPLVLTDPGLTLTVIENLTSLSSKLRRMNRLKLIPARPVIINMLEESTIMSVMIRFLDRLEQDENRLFYVKSKTINLLVVWHNLLLDIADEEDTSNGLEDFLDIDEPGEVDSETG